MTVRVVSKRAGGTKPIAGEVVYNIARPSVLGNPFIMKDESQRAAVVAQYREWLIDKVNKGGEVQYTMYALARRVRNGENLALECWCAPCACHGDVLVEAINWINERIKS